MVKAQIGENEIINIEIDEVIDNRYIDHVIDYFNKATKFTAGVSIIYDIETGKYGYWWTKRNLKNHSSFEKAEIVLEVPGGIVALGDKSVPKFNYTFNDYLNYFNPWIIDSFDVYKNFMDRYMIDSLL